MLVSEGLKTIKPCGFIEDTVTEDTPTPRALVAFNDRRFSGPCELNLRNHGIAVTIIDTLDELFTEARHAFDLYVLEVGFGVQDKAVEHATEWYRRLSPHGHVRLVALQHQYESGLMERQIPFISQIDYSARDIALTFKESRQNRSA